MSAVVCPLRETSSAGDVFICWSGARRPVFNCARTSDDFIDSTETLTAFTAQMALREIRKLHYIQYIGFKGCSTRAPTNHHSKIK